MIRGINELETLTVHISCKCKYRFDGKKCNSDVSVNVKNVTYVKKIIFGIRLHVVAKM